MSVQVTSLPSGLAVVTDTTPQLKTAAIGVFVAAGSRHERAGEHGLSHLLEHMAFKGTRRRSAREIAEEIEDVGGDLNAETGVEQTGYFARVLGERRRLSRSTSSATFSPTASSTRMSSSARRTSSSRRSERSRTRPDDLVFDLLTAAAWPDQPIGRPILGTRERVEAFDRAAIDGYLTPPLSAPARPSSPPPARSTTTISSNSRDPASRGSPRRRRPPKSAAVAYRGGETRLQPAPRADACRRRLRGSAGPRAGPRRRSGFRRRGRRRHVVAALSGGAREARPRLFDLCIPLGFHRHRPLRLLRGLGRPGRGGGGRRLARLPGGSRAWA